jgi:hypothetical protein
MADPSLALIDHTDRLGVGALRSPPSSLRSATP